MICDRHRCVFIHVPKTAGTSLAISLGWISDAPATYGAQDHRTIRECHDVMDPATFGAYFKFAFVRNPWDRVVSWYKNLVEDPVQSNAFGLRSGCGFAEYLRDHSGSWPMRPQLDWLCDEQGGVALDFVGRYEFLQRDYAFIRARLGLARERLPQRAGAEDRTPYQEFYTPETRDLVAELFREEIEMFGYTFG